MKKILFIIPHPDDEIVGSCILIKNFLTNGKKVLIFFATNGLISKESLWPWQKRYFRSNFLLRKKEMRRSLKNLGVTQYFFQNIPTRTLKDNINKTYFKIKKILDSKKIDTIFCPSYEGGHQDHDVSNFICSRLKPYCNIFEFPEYNYFNQRINNNTFIDSSFSHKVIKLNNKEIKFKKRMISIYRSEKKNLNYVDFEKESYRPLFDYNYSIPPHKGTLFYRRFRFFSWHPKVDSDNPLEICNKIANSKIFKK